MRSLKIEGWSLALQNIGLEAKYDTLKSPDKHDREKEGRSEHLYSF